MKISGLPEQYSGDSDVYVEQEGAHVKLAVEAEQGNDQGVSLLTPAQARLVAAELSRLAILADEYSEAVALP